MKTAISMKDSLLIEADKVARLLGLSRSGLFARAVDEFLDRHRQSTILAQLNDACATDSGNAEPQLPAMKAKFRGTLRERW